MPFSLLLVIFNIFMERQHKNIGLASGYPGFHYTVIGVIGVLFLANADSRNKKSLRGVNPQAPSEPSTAFYLVIAVIVAR